MPQLLPFDLDAIDRCAVGAIDVFHIEGVIDILKNGVVATDRQIIQNDVVIRPAPQRDMVFVQHHLAHSHAVQRNNQLGHVSTLVYKTDIDNTQPPSPIKTACPPLGRDIKNGYFTNTACFDMEMKQ